MKTIITEELYDYLLKINRTEHLILRGLREETSGLPGHHMQISPEQGQFMAMLAKIAGATKYLEIGVFTGYSSLVMALAMGDQAQTFALDNDQKVIDIATKYWQKAGVIKNITPIVDDALISLDKLIKLGHEGTFDIAFIDAKKSDYREYFEYCYLLVKDNGIQLIDNTFMHGDVLKSTANNAVKSIQKFNQQLKDDLRVDICVTPIADGLTIARKRSKNEKT